MLNANDVAGWNELRKNIPKSTRKKKLLSKMCRKCVWANTESGKILCSRQCDGKRSFAIK